MHLEQKGGSRICIWSFHFCLQKIEVSKSDSYNLNPGFKAQPVASVTGVVLANGKKGDVLKQSIT